MVRMYHMSFLPLLGNLSNPKTEMATTGLSRGEAQAERTA